MSECKVIYKIEELQMEQPTQKEQPEQIERLHLPETCSYEHVKEKAEKINGSSEQLREALANVVKSCEAACKSGFPYFLLNLIKLSIDIKKMVIEDICEKFPFVYYRGSATRERVNFLLSLFVDDDPTASRESTPGGYSIIKVPSRDQWDIERYNHLLVSISENFHAEKYAWPIDLDVK